MADTAKKDNQTPDLVGGEAAPQIDGLTQEFGARAEKREFGTVTFFEFEDGTSAKVWDTTKGHVSVLVQDVNGRGTSADLTEDVTVTAANTLIESAGQKAKDNVAAQKAAN